MGKRGVKRPRQMQGIKATQPKRSMAIATPAAVAAMLHNSVGESNPTPPKHQTKNQARNGKGKRKPKQPMREPGQAIRPVREVKPVTPSSQLDLINSANPNPKRIGLYTNSHRILLVGEGDFSFGAALATAVGGNKLVATSYDGRSLVLGKYRATAPAAIAKLKRTGAVILHNIDAVELQKSLEAEWEKGLRADTSVLGTHGSHPPAFDRIVFNFPHAGGATEEDVRENRRIL